MENHILIIDDDKILRENIAEILQFASYKVSTASNGKMGVKLIREILPDLILCDILMPKLDGFGVYQILAKDEKLKHIPFIFLTAKSSNFDRRKGMGLGADDYITKPFDESNLLTAIEVRLKKSKSKKTNGTIVNNIGVTGISQKIKTLKELTYILCKKTHHLYKKGDSLYAEGNRSNHVFLVKKGSVKTFKNTEEGKELITGLYKKNHFFGYTSLLGDFPHNENAEVLEDSKLVRVGKEEIASIFKNNPTLALNILALLSNNIKIIKNSMLQMAYGSVRFRTAKSLLILCKNSDENNIVISRYDLASFTGIAKETLIRTLSDFKDEGMIDTTRSLVKIINVNKLNNVY